MGISGRSPSTRNCFPRSIRNVHAAQRLLLRAGLRHKFHQPFVDACREHPDNLPMRLKTLFLAVACAATAAGAQQPGSASTPERDAAAVYIAQANFIVSRLATECLSVLGRAESPKNYVAGWQDRNASFVAASARYLDQRVQEAGADQADAVRAAFRKAVTDNGESALRGLLQGHREEGCMQGITLVDTGALDINSKQPQYGQLEALVRWAAP